MGSASTSFIRKAACRSAVLLALVLLAPIQPAAAANGCTRILVESRAGTSVLSSYTVAEADYVSKLHRLIDQSGQGGTWAVAAGELGSAGYSVSYTCLP
jgi:hypothetical protein